MIKSNQSIPCDKENRSRRSRLFGVVRALVAAAALWAPMWAAAQSAGLTVQIPSSELTATASAWYSSSLSPDKTVDENSATYVWITGTSPATWLQFDLGYGRWVSRLDIYATQNRIRGYEVYVSTEPDPVDWGDPVASGELPNTSAYHSIPFDFIYGRYVRLAVLSGWGSRIYVYEARLHEASFKMADKQTGHRGYTNSNKADVAALPVMAGYDAYQITASAAEPVGGWLPYASTNAPVGLEADLGSPAEEAVVTRYAWFKDESAGILPTTNAPASITYVRDNADVEALLVSSYSAPTWGAALPADIRMVHVDAGSGSSIGVFSAVLSVAPDGDLTPDDPHRITLADTGSYTLTLTVTDNAGNVDTATCPLTVFAGAAGQTTLWTGAGDGADWNDNDNWSNYTPSPGAHVALTNAVTVFLKQSTPVLASLTVSNNATLVFTNWNTTLNADTVTVGAKGTLTCAGPFRNEEMSNNVVVVCDSFTLAPGGSISLDGKGYAGAIQTDARGHGPGGGGMQHSGNGGGGGHGGTGGTGGINGAVVPSQASRGGVPYGFADAPLYPGSGGGASTAYANYFGGDGGGAARLEVAGACLIEGTISANGFFKSTRGGCGSGGSVFITCGTLAGSAGIVRAEGEDGTNQSGGGAGGRIAVSVTNQAVQAGLPVPRILFSVRRGVSAYYADGELGTLWFSDTDLVDWTFMPHSGRFASTVPNPWTVDHLVVSNGYIQILSNDFAFVVANDLTLQGRDAILQLAPNNGLDVGGSLFIQDGARLHVNGHRSQVSTLTVGANLSLTNPAGGSDVSSLLVESSYASATAVTGGIEIVVGGDLVLDNHAWIYPRSNPTNGASVSFRAENIYVLGTESGFDVDERGYGVTARNGSRGPGRGLGPNYGGGGYGGLGGFGSVGGSGTIYGSAAMPIEPGSTGRLRFEPAYNLPPAGFGWGGGLIWIEATDRVVVNGTLTANGGDAPRGGGGSGGGIYVHCRRFSGSETGLLSANGGRYTNASVPTQDIAGGGGAGRIAIWRVSDAYQGAYSLLGGTSTHTDPAADGAPGEVFLGALPAEGTVLLLR